MTEVPQWLYAMPQPFMSSHACHPVEFCVNGLRGICLSDALVEGHVRGLANAEEQVANDVGSRILYRIKV